MKKAILLAASVAAFSTAAQAETSVTLYGLIDTGIGYANVDGSVTNPATGARSSFDASRIGSTTGNTAGSRWGLRGKEDLGDGLYASFRMESGFDSNNGNSLQNGRLFGREATVGLGSKAWGDFTIGRQYNVASRLYVSMFGPQFGGFTQLNTGAGLGFSAANFVRYDNLALFESARFAGFQVSAGYSFNADDRNTAQTGFATAENTRAITAGVNYANGPLVAFFAYDQLNPSGKLSSAQKATTPRSFTVGGSYDFEVVKLALAYERINDGWFAGKSLPNGAAIGSFRGVPSTSFVDGFSANSYLLGLSAPLGKAGTIFGSWQRVDPNNNSLTGGDSTTNTFSLGYSYAMSKRTSLYALGQYSKNYAFMDDVKATEATVGIRHAF